MNLKRSTLNVKIQKWGFGQSAVIGRTYENPNWIRILGKLPSYSYSWPVGNPCLELKGKYYCILPYINTRQSPKHPPWGQCRWMCRSSWFSGCFPVLTLRTTWCGQSEWACRTLFRSSAHIPHFVAIVSQNWKKMKMTGGHEYKAT